MLASFGVYPNALAHVTKSTRPSLRLTPGQRSHVKIVRGERGPGNEAKSGVACLFHARGRNSQVTLASTTRTAGMYDYIMARHFHVISGWGFCISHIAPTSSLQHSLAFHDGCHRLSRRGSLSGLCRIVSGAHECVRTVRGSVL